jgi:uncharacterized damage-inducible protein DinB
MLMKISELLRNEFEQEAANTIKLLERVPEDQLSWTPHPQSMTLGQLSLHIAIIPGELSELFAELQREVPDVPLPEATSKAEILAAFEKSVRKAQEYLTIWDDPQLMLTWNMTQGENRILSAPRVMMVRTAMLNHWYHHRGQLVVYLRLLDVPVPALYGSSADEP